MALLCGWMRSEERATPRADRVAAEDLAAIRVREQRLAERLADERGERADAEPSQAGSGVARYSR